VDLPGYGYAAVPEKIRLHWRTVLSTYLQTRSSLRGLVLIMDVRHPLTDLDRQMLAWFQPTGKPVHVLLTKSDKLNRQQAQATLRAVGKELAEIYPGATIQLFSSSKHQGMQEAERAIGRWFEPVAEIPAVDEADNSAS
jgi:GTP-binding protein